ncbi:hypothetical protein HSBAA_18000 [Vreelandella sulfidaeris]|uniref:Ribosome biogenesis GTPase YlqF n=1 Tax=Vreelandella sulfidaeris TaxID=115553 RepID=A0A455UB86_9GAMM|nr:hypothetical protein HSBAA_18000 [Halomonas sulfidaeris]
MLGWFPGHMNKARRQIKEVLPEIDVVIEVLDARLPYSSANPMLAELTRHKPVLKILSRADLADPERTAEWVAFSMPKRTCAPWLLPPPIPVS